MRTLILVAAIFCAAPVTQVNADYAERCQEYCAKGGMDPSLRVDGCRGTVCECVPR